VFGILKKLGRNTIQGIASVPIRDKGLMYSTGQWFLQIIQYSIYCIVIIEMENFYSLCFLCLKSTVLFYIPYKIFPVPILVVVGLFLDCHLSGLLCNKTLITLNTFQQQKNFGISIKMQLLKYFNYDLLLLRK